MTLTLVFTGGGEAAEYAAGKDFTPDPPSRDSKWTAFLALARITKDVIRREKCDTFVLRHIDRGPHNLLIILVVVVSLCSTVVMVKKRE